MYIYIEQTLTPLQKHSQGGPALYRSACLASAQLAQVTTTLLNSRDSIAVTAGTKKFMQNRAQPNQATDLLTMLDKNEGSDRPSSPSLAQRLCQMRVYDRVNVSPGSLRQMVLASLPPGTQTLA